ncbi:MAG: hemolysin III family protein, partial [Pseudomonadota bacterium]|nr:hemolysin III family protein [Pseudomonadota bacterium]
IALLVAGGITYTLGVIFYAVRAIPFHHAIWHLFVIGGSVCHFFAVYTAVLPFQA